MWKIKGDEWSGWWVVNAQGLQITPVYLEEEPCRKYIEALVHALRSMGG